MASWGRRYYFFWGGYILLPVEFCSLTATIFNRSGHISWQTKSEINNAGFEVQKSMDGISWDSLGFAQGAGSSSLTLDYILNQWGNCDIRVSTKFQWGILYCTVTSKIVHRSVLCSSRKFH